jgi:hypothetical protein
MEQHLKLEASKLTHANDDLILMMHHYHEQEIDEKSILEIAEEKPRSYDESRLEQDGENIQQNEKEQMEDDIMHQINSSTDEIIASFENLSVEESDNDTKAMGPQMKKYTLRCLGNQPITSITEPMNQNKKSSMKTPIQTMESTMISTWRIPAQISLFDYNDKMKQSKD